MKNILVMSLVLSATAFSNTAFAANIIARGISTTLTAPVEAEKTLFTVYDDGTVIDRNGKLALTLAPERIITLSESVKTLEVEKLNDTTPNYPSCPSAEVERIDAINQNGKSVSMYLSVGCHEFIPATFQGNFVSNMLQAIFTLVYP